MEITRPLAHDYKSSDDNDGCATSGVVEFGDKEPVIWVAEYPSLQRVREGQIQSARLQDEKVRRSSG